MFFGNTCNCVFLETAHFKIYIIIFCEKNYHRPIYLIKSREKTVILPSYVTDVDT